MSHGRAADHVVIHVVDDHAVFFRGQVSQKVDDIVGVERRGLRRHPAGKIGVADDRDTAFGHDLLVWNGQITVTTPFSGQIDDHRTRLHRLDHVRKPELGRIAAGDQGGGDDNIDIRRLLAEQRQLLLPELRRGRGRIAARGRAVGGIIEVKEQELGAHALDLLGDLGANVKGADDRAQ